MISEQVISTWRKRIKAIRLKKITIARDTNISYGCVLKAFSGKHTPRTDTFDKIEEYIAKMEANHG